MRWSVVALVGISLGCNLPKGKKEGSKESASRRDDKPAFNLHDGNVGHIDGVAFLKVGTTFCSGVVVKNRCILTSAHCVDKNNTANSLYYVDGADPLADLSDVKLVPARSFNYHPHFRAGNLQFDPFRDLALIWTAKEGCSSSVTYTKPTLTIDSPQRCTPGRIREQASGAFTPIWSPITPHADQIPDGSNVIIAGFGGWQDHPLPRQSNDTFKVYRTKIGPTTTPPQTEYGALVQVVSPADDRLDSNGNLVTKGGRIDTGDSGGPMFYNARLVGNVSGGSSDAAPDGKHLVNITTYSQDNQVVIEDFMDEVCRPTFYVTLDPGSDVPGYVTGDPEDSLGKLPTNWDLHCTAPLQPNDVCASPNKVEKITLQAHGNFDHWEHLSEEYAQLCPCAEGDRATNPTCVIEAKDISFEVEEKGASCVFHFKQNVTPTPTPCFVPSPDGDPSSDPSPAGSGNPIAPPQQSQSSSPSASPGDPCGTPTPSATSTPTPTPTGTCILDELGNPIAPPDGGTSPCYTPTVTPSSTSTPSPSATSSPSSSPTPQPSSGTCADSIPGNCSQAMIQCLQNGFSTPECDYTSAAYNAYMLCPIGVSQYLALCNQ